MSDYFYTGVSATEEEEKAIRSSFNVPVMIVGGSLPISPGEVMHAYALKHGLPDIVGHYGYDFQKHEFIRMHGADQGTPDTWPSHRLEDILRATSGEHQKSAPSSSHGTQR